MKWTVLARQDPGRPFRASDRRGESPAFAKPRETGLMTAAFKALSRAVAAVVAVAALALLVSCGAAKAQAEVQPGVQPGGTPGVPSGLQPEDNTEAKAFDPARAGPVAVATDFHFLAPSLRDDGPAFRRIASGGDGKDLERGEALLDALARDLSLAGARALVVTGDLTLNGERESHLALAARFRALESAGIGVFVAPGNHDVANPWARAFRGERQFVVPGVGPGEFAEIYRDFGFAEALARDKGSLSYVAKLAPGLRLLVLDTNRYGENAALGRPVTGGALPEATRAFVRRAGREARAAGDTLLAAMHHSLVDHSPVITRGFTVEDSAGVAALFREAGIRAVLTGHIHIQDIAASGEGAAAVYDIATNSLAVHPHQFGLVEPKGEGRELRYRTARLDVEGWARAAGLADPVLLDYAEASERSFRAEAIKMTNEALGELVGGAGKISQAAEAMATLNLRYFAGREKDNEADLAGSEGFTLLATQGTGFVAAYASSILRDADAIDDNALEF